MCYVCLCCAVLSVPWGLVVTCWERALLCVVCSCISTNLSFSPIQVGNVSYDTTKHLISTALLWVGGLDYKVVFGLF